MEEDEDEEKGDSIDFTKEEEEETKPKVAFTGDGVGIGIGVTGEFEVNLFFPNLYEVRSKTGEGDGVVEIDLPASLNVVRDRVDMRY